MKQKYIQNMAVHFILWVLQYLLPITKDGGYAPTSLFYATNGILVVSAFIFMVIVLTKKYYKLSFFFLVYILFTALWMFIFTFLN